MQCKEIYQGINFSIIAAPMVRDYKAGKQTFEDVCRMVVEHGIGHLDLMEPEVEAYGLSDVKEQMKKYDLKPACFISFISINIGVKEKIQERIKKALKMAAELGFQMFMPVLMPQNEVDQFRKMDRETLVNDVEAYLRWTVEEAKPYGIKVCIEETPNYELPICSAEECMHILEHVPGLGCVFDTANMIPAGDDPFAFYERVKEYICHVHLKDARYTEAEGWDKCKDGRYITGCVYGEGVIPVNQLKKRLVEDGFKGYCAIEYMEPEEMGIKANADQLSRMAAYLKEI